MPSKFGNLLALVLVGGTVCTRHFAAESTPLNRLLEATAEGNTIILTQCSCGYVDFAVNWITHAEALGITNWLTLCEDEATLKYLDSRWAPSNV